jgi:hypothetical protein
LLKEKLGPEAVRAHLVHQATLNPGKESLQQAIMMILKPDDARKLLETHLADRPVLVDWHRGYQQLMDRNFPQEDTSTRYRQWMEAEPDNGSLIYLYARTLHDRSQSQVLNEKATRAKIPSNYAFYALGTEAFIDGDYTRSLELLDRAEKAGLKSDALRLRQRDAFLALNRIDDVLARTKQRRAAEPLNTTLFVDELMLSQARKPDRIAGQRSIATFITAVRGKLGAADPELDPYLASHLAYSLGDERDAGVSLTKVKGPWHAFEAAVAQRDHVAAARAIKDHPQHISRFQWILMLTAHAAGDEAAAEKYYQSALAELEQEDSYGREIAQLVKTPSAEAAQKIMQHPTFADELRVMLTALGVRMPEQRAALFKRASELDHDPAFPHLLLTSVRQKLASAQ